MKSMAVGMVTALPGEVNPLVDLALDHLGGWLRVFPVCSMCGNNVESMTPNMELDMIQKEIVLQPETFCSTQENTVGNILESKMVSKLSAALKVLIPVTLRVEEADF